MNLSAKYVTFICVDCINFVPKQILRKIIIGLTASFTCIGISFYAGTKFVTYKNNPVQKITNSEPESNVNLVPVVSPQPTPDSPDKQQSQKQEEHQENKTQALNKESDDPITVQKNQENEIESEQPQNISDPNTQYTQQPQSQEQQQKSEQLQKRQEQLIQYFEQQRQEQEALKQRQLRINQAGLVCLKQKTEALKGINKRRSITSDGSDDIVSKLVDNINDLAEDKMNIDYKSCMEQAQLTP